MKKLMFLLIFTAVSITLSIHIHAATIVTDGLVSYWTFERHTIKDGIAKDVWGENDATIMGNPKIADGYLRQGLKFDGAGDYVILENLGNFQSRIGASSFEFWVKTSYDRRNTVFKVIEEVRGGPNRLTDKGWGIHLNASIQPPNLHNLLNNIAQGGGNEGGGNDGIIYKKGGILIESVYNSEKTFGYVAINYSAPISDGKWHHIVYMNNLYIDEFGKAKYEKVIFIDSIRKSWELPERRERPGVPGIHDINANPNKLIPFTQPVFLGAINDNGKAKRSFRGVFDEVRVYDRMLTDEEVLQNFESGIGLSVEPTEKLSTVWGALKARR